MSTCPRNIVVTPNNNPVDRMEVDVSLREDTVHIQIPRNFYGQAYWVVRFKKRKNNPPSIRGNVLMKKITVDEILSPVKRLEEIPGIWTDINAAIHEGLRDVVEIAPKGARWSREFHAPLDLEIPLNNAKSSYIYMDYPGQVMDGPDYYLIDLPLFVDRLLQQGKDETQ